MGNPVARGDGVDSVDSDTGSGNNCESPLVTSTAECSGDVRVNGTGVVREEDAVASHNQTGCVSEAPTLSTYSSTVRANGKWLGRKGDDYDGDGSNIISSGSDDVNAG
jgi:uncharacterized Zn-binding protein involved in type VI secretion